MKRYIVEVEVDEDKLYEVAGGVRHEFLLHDALVEEMSWTKQSGIYTKSVKEISSEEPMTSVWDFVTKYFPRYFSSEEIAYECDLKKLLDQEYEEEDCAYNLLHGAFDGDINNPQIRIEWYRTLIQIYETAIEGYIEQLNGETTD